MAVETKEVGSWRNFSEEGGKRKSDKRKRRKTFWEQRPPKWRQAHALAKKTPGKGPKKVGGCSRHKKTRRPVPKRRRTRTPMPKKTNIKTNQNQANKQRNKTKKQEKTVYKKENGKTPKNFTNHPTNHQPNPKSRKRNHN